MSRQVRCHRCGALFMADRLTGILPPRWRLCPRCRGPLPPSGTVPVRDLGRPQLTLMEGDS
jgi:hypothetical protein